MHYVYTLSSGLYSFPPRTKPEESEKRNSDQLGALGDSSSSSSSLAVTSPEDPGDYNYNDLGWDLLDTTDLAEPRVFFNLNFTTANLVDPSTAVAIVLGISALIGVLGGLAYLAMQAKQESDDDDDNDSYGGG